VESVTAEEMVVRHPQTGREEIYRLEQDPGDPNFADVPRDKFLPFPIMRSSMEWATIRLDDGTERRIQPGDEVAARQLIARGHTAIFFQANVYIFTVLVMLLGLAMGLGKAAVYKHIPNYFPNDVGAVGGLVGVIGGLGGFVCPILFGLMLDWTGVWTTCWIFLFVLSMICLIWMHLVIRSIMKQEAPVLIRQLEHHEPSKPVDSRRRDGRQAPELAGTR
jgi:hypothetical protein